MRVRTAPVPDAALDGAPGEARTGAEQSAAVHRDAGGPAARLSAAQLRVAELAASGLPNAAIAEILAITKRTVELHLSNAYRALGITSRSQLSGVLGGAVGEHSAMC